MVEPVKKELSNLSENNQPKKQKWRLLLRERYDWSSEGAGTKDQNMCLNIRGGLPSNPWSLDTWSKPMCFPYHPFPFPFIGVEHQEGPKEVKIFIFVLSTFCSISYFNQITLLA